jgi:enolase 1/2/3
MYNNPIIDIIAREVFDSSGNPTVEVDVICKKSSGRASVPSGASKGDKEACELRDGNPEWFQGKGVYRAIENINKEIKEALRGCNVFNQRAIDETLIELDGTKDKSRLGANAILAVSLASARAASIAKNMPLFQYLRPDGAHSLPTPLFNIFAGSRPHHEFLNFQELMIIPLNMSMRDSFHCAHKIFNLCKVEMEMVKKSFFSSGTGSHVGDFYSDFECFDMLLDCIGKSGYAIGDQVKLAVDFAANSFCRDESYKLSGKKELLKAEDLMEYYESLLKKYPIAIIEDPFSEDDWTAWQQFSKKRNDILLVGDDLFVTNSSLLKKGIDLKCANAILIKPNQVGTLSETLETALLAKCSGYKTIFSMRSGETEDNWAVDVALACGADYCKSGAPRHSDRIAKINQYLRLEELIT